MTGAVVEKKVVLRYEVDASQATREHERLAASANKAAEAAKNLQGAAAGGWGGHAPPSAHAMGFPSIAGGYGTPNGPVNFGALGAASWRDPLAAMQAMRGSGAVAGGPSGWDARALAQAGRTPSSGWNPAALAESSRRMIDPHTGMKIDSYRVDSLRHARYSGTSDEMLQTMNQHRTDPGMLAALGAGAYRLGAAGLKYGVPAIAAVKTASAVASAVHDADLAAHQGATGGEQMRALANGTWLSRQVLGISDDFRGRSQGMARVQYDARIRQFGNEAAEEQRLTENRIRLDRMRDESRYNVLNADGRMARVGSFDRTTVQGELDYGRSLQTMGARQAVFDTERELKAGQGYLAGMEGRKDELEMRSRKLEIERGRLMNQADGAGGMERADLLTRVQTKNDQLESAKAELKELTNNINAARGDIVRLGAEASRAKIGAMQANLNVLEQRESRAASQASRYGGMTNLEFDLGVSALRQAQSGGLRSLTPDQRGRLQGFAGEQFEKMAQAEFTKSGRFDTLKELGVVEDRLPDARKAVDNERNKIADAIRDANREAAKAALDNVNTDEIIKDLKAQINQAAEIAVNKFKTEIKQGFGRQ